tara:strand:+ start:3612 stop:4961 length:1350 start_codon:yes stop_codon:yes gene_type:complete
VLNHIFLLFYKTYASFYFKKFKSNLKTPHIIQEKLKRDLQIDNQIPQTFEEFKKSGFNIPKNETIIAYELTSGSGGATKKIPYTKSLMKSFQIMFIIWSYDVLKNISFRSLKMFFTVSPQFIENPQGLKDDSEYLSGVTGWLVKRFLVQVPGVSSLKDSNSYKKAICQSFIETPDLEIISVWSPTYLLEMVDYLENNMGISRQSAFPKLKFISAWGHANAEADFHKLQKLFPNVIFQKKGLLATEAPLSIPLINSDLQVPLINEVYFEFLDDQNNLLKLNEVKQGSIYEMIISQKGGLVRYKIKDLVKITGKISNTPCFEFVARADKLTDLVGEKLHELDTYQAIEGSKVKFVVPDKENKRYIFLSESHLSEAEIDKVEKGLRKNIHYHNARELGQLKTPVHCTIENLNSRISQVYEHIFKIKKGDIKLGPLIYRNPDQVISLLNKSES